MCLAYKQDVEMLRTEMIGLNSLSTKTQRYKFL